MKSRVAYLVDKGKIEMGERDCPRPEGDEVLIKVKHCGICGSDVHNYIEGGTGKRIIKFPFILGHELAGEVVALGDQVKALKIGDHVCVEPGVPCGSCEYCRKGEYNLCPDMKFMAAYPIEGSMQEYLTFPESNCYQLPEQVSTIQGALIEPFAVGLYAAEQAGVKVNDTVVILGMGCIGLMTLLAAKVRNAGRIIAVDIYDSHLQMAKALGADVVINSTKEDVAAVVEAVTGSKLADVTFETAGQSSTTLLAPALTKRGGIIMCVGNITKPTPYKFFDISSKEITLKTQFRYRNVFALAVDLIASGKVDLTPLNPKIFPFSETQEAFQYAINHAENTVKCMLEMEQ